MDGRFIEMLFREKEYYNIVKQTILYMIPGIGSHDFDDCVSEVYLSALKTKNLEKHLNIKGWLNITAKNIAKRYKTKRAAERIIISEKDIDKKVADKNDFVFDIENKAGYEEVLNKFSESLSKSDYRLFKLKYIERLSSKEIGDILGIKADSVDIKLIRLKNKIKNIL